MSYIIRDPFTYWTQLHEVEDQLLKQVDKWGIQNHPDGTGEPGDEDVALYHKEECEWAREHGLLSWRHILMEEVAEAFAEAPGSEALRVELIQVAAVAVAWAERLNKRRSDGAG